MRCSASLLGVISSLKPRKRKVIRRRESIVAKRGKALVRISSRGSSNSGMTSARALRREKLENL